MKQRHLKFELMRGVGGAWYWCLRGKTGKLLAISSSHYKTRKHAKEAVEHLIDAMTKGEIFLAVHDGFSF